jgi:uncharacterized membrane protein YphA (DoxX/SURF4 family)
MAQREGSMPWVVFALRIVVGGILLAAGALKLGHTAALAENIAGLRLLPAAVVLPVAIALPPLELILGFYLVTGLFTRIAGGVVCAMLLLYAAVVASAIVRHLEVSCGCFGPADTAAPDWPHVAADVLLAAIALWIERAAPGALSLDRLLTRLATKESS